MGFFRRYFWQLTKHQTLTLVTILGYVLTRKPSEYADAHTDRMALMMDASLKGLYNDLIKNDPKFAHMPPAILTADEKAAVDES